VSTKPNSPKRPRDAAATREALLQAARALFAERGYDRTTLRQVGDRAGVDAALVARYFGGKEGLYDAVFASEQPVDLSGGPGAVAEALLDRWDSAGVGPMVQALTRPELEEGVRRRMIGTFNEALLDPLTAHLERQGVTDARLRADILAAALIGIGVVRCGGGLEALRDADRDVILRVLDRPLAEITRPG
jgi:AcrR family transcriptional regulator